jgi:DNA-binding winged helix-turn-helix (wHTH) protein/Tol biopolymer transport system component
MSVDARPLTDYRFLDWHYASAQRLLRSPDREKRLKPLLDRLLRQLLDEPGAMLAREHLIDQVWSRRLVNDEVLSRAIAELRALLGDDAREPRFIETLSKGGYRWIAPVARVAADSGPEPTLEKPFSQSPAVRRNGPFVLVLGAAFLLLASVSWLLLPRPAPNPTARATLAVDLLGARPLTADPRLEYDARFDPIGRVVYIRSDRGSEASELVMVDPVSLAERVLWQDSHSLRHPAPSPDGREIALTRLNGQDCELWSVTLVDGHRTRIGDCANTALGGLEWSDKGANLLFTGKAIDQQHAPGLMRLERRSGNIDTLTAPDAGEGAHVDPRLSADGKWLVYASTHDGDKQLWRTAWPTMSSRSALLKRPEPVFEHAFEADGETLWIAGDLTIYRALHRLRRGGQPELIGGRGARSIDLAANGSAVWSEANYDADIWLRRDADSAWQVVARSIRYESQPEFSADARLLAIGSNRNGAESILVYDTIEGTTRQLALDPRFRWVRPTWSARDQSLILTAYEDRYTRLYRYQLDGNILGAIEHVDAGAFHGTELVDRLLYLSGHGTEQSTLMQLRHGRLAGENLGLGAVAAYRASGNWIAWRAPRSHQIRVASLEHLGAIREIPLANEGGVEAFALNGNTLSYLDRGQLWSVTLPDGEPATTPAEHLPDIPGPGLAISGNGAMATATLTSLSMDLMIATPAPGKN